MSATASPENLLRHGLTRVLSDAQSGELPLFVWTQGLPQDELLAVVRFCLPRLGAVQPMPAAEYRHLQQQVPPDVAVLAVCCRRGAEVTRRRIANVTVVDVGHLEDLARLFTVAGVAR